MSKKLNVLTTALLQGDHTFYPIQFWNNSQAKYPLTSNHLSLIADM